MHHTFDFTRLVPGRDLSRLSTFVQMAQIARARADALRLLERTVERTRQHETLHIRRRRREKPSSSESLRRAVPVGVLRGPLPLVHAARLDGELRLPPEHLLRAVSLGVNLRRVTRPPRDDLHGNLYTKHDVNLNLIAHTTYENSPPYQPPWRTPPRARARRYSCRCRG